MDDLEAARHDPRRFGPEHNEDVAESAYPVPGTSGNGTGILPGPHSLPDMGGDPIGYVETYDAGEMHREVLAALGALSAGDAAILKALMYYEATIIRVDGGGVTPNPVNAGQVGLSHYRGRLRAICFSRATAGDTDLIFGSNRYTFTLPASPVVVSPFPLVIERGTDLSATGDGRHYLICTVE